MNLLPKNAMNGVIIRVERGERVKPKIDLEKGPPATADNNRL